MLSTASTANLRRPFLAVAMIGAAAFAASATVSADSTELPITHIAAGKFPALKTKTSNANFALDGAAGNAVMRSRYGTESSPTNEKTYVFGYQLELKATYGVNGTPGVTAVTLDLPTPPPLVTAKALPEDTRIYVIDEASDADGGVDLRSAALVDGKIVFTFTAPVKAGKKPGDGQHSLWFGLVTSFRAKHGQMALAAAVPDQKKTGTQQKAVAATEPQTVDVLLPMPLTDSN